ncbi:hypothetical protein E4U13_006379 [Claviceps humidiphila]|uniref:ARID domain-containing protein n=1 Tax=Claviceps humidiphila TaxID=1294629 RepID=A0A9P7PVX5_9HYPO|nr:hypothetical protein E4U13_006379 [Claviceps humidiphila]
MATSRMASSVMYDDAQIATETPRPRFNDIVFWVHDKVPSRDFFVGLIEGDGGIISPLPERAKIRIEVVQNSLRLPKHTRARRRTCSKASPSTSSFTHDEDVALARHVRPHTARSRAGLPLYRAFAKSNTSHSPQEWRKRWVDVLSLRPEPGQLKITFGRTPAAAAPPPSPSRASNASSSASQPSRPSPVSPVPCPRRKGQQQLSWGSTPAAAAPPPSPPRASNASSSASQPPRELTVSCEPSPAHSEEAVVGTGVDEKRKFIRDLILFSEEDGPDVDIHPEVGGQSLDLWALSQAVAAQQVPIDKVDWLNVVERLHFKQTKDGRLADEVQDCYKKNLSEFLQVCR